MGTHQVQYLDDESGQIKIQNKAMRQQYIMKELLDLKKKPEVLEKDFKWQFTDNANVKQYRESIVSFYLLEHEASIYPKYVDYSDLSKNLCQEYVTDIKLYYCPEIKKEMEQIGQMQQQVKLNPDILSSPDRRSNLLQEERKEYDLLKDISLLNTAQKLIKIATKQLFNKLHQQFRKETFKGKVKVLKFKNYESYLYGDNQLIYFQEIREHLRYNKDIELILQVVEDNDESSHFPPLYNMQHEICQPNMILKEPIHDIEAPQKSFFSRASLKQKKSSLKLLALNREQLTEDSVVSLNNITVKLESYINVINQAQEIEKIVYYDTSYKVSEREEHNTKSDIVQNCEKQLYAKELQQLPRLKQNSMVMNHSNFFSLLGYYHHAKFKLKEEEGKKKHKIFQIKSKYIQIQAAIYLGCQQISEFSYTQPVLFNNNNIFHDLKLSFMKKDHHIEESLASCSSKSFKTSMIAKEKSKQKILKIRDLPSNARLCMNIIVLEENSNEKKLPIREGYVFGSVSVSIFDQDRIMRQGVQELLLWPFQQFNPRMICQNECYLYEAKEDLQKPHTTRMNIELKFPVFQCEVEWKLSPKSSKSEKINQKEQQIFEETINNETDLAKESMQLKAVKDLIDAYPLEDRKKNYTQTKKLLHQYRDYIDVLPAFVKTIDFTKQDEIAICYDYLKRSEQAKNMEPQEALALLDAQFGDARVRLFAVQKLSYLNDSFISLYMPQLVQALKYELYHRSPLSEFLLERALKNTRVVGHALYWSMKANLSNYQSYERFYLILERFLMCCGKFKNQLYQQNEVNKSLIDVFINVRSLKEQQKKNFDKKAAEAKMFQWLKEKEIKMKLYFNLILTHEKYDDQNGYEFNLGEIRKLVKQKKMEIMQGCSENNDKLPSIEIKYQNALVEYYKEVFFFPFEPKKPVQRFNPKSSICSSKQMPLRILVELQDYTDRVQEEEPHSSDQKEKPEKQLMEIMFKFGDDLRQDGLVLQFFKLMDKLWLQNNLDLEMVAYNVMETGYKVGYIELVTESKEIAEIHQWKGIFNGPFNEKSIYDYFKQELLKKGKIQKKMYQYHDTFIKSLAGQCVATYILGIKDRHTGNFMLQEKTGKFFHIDFGHVLGRPKKKFGIIRDREPFIYSPELHYFLTHLHKLYPEGELDQVRQHKNILIQNNYQVQKSNVSEQHIKKKKNPFLACMSKPVSKQDEEGEINKKKFKQFEEYCCKAFKILRQNAYIFINLLMLMLVGGIKQVNQDSIKYFIDSLLLNKSDEEASFDFKKLIQDALNTSYRKYDNVFHNITHLAKDRKKKKEKNSNKNK